MALELCASFQSPLWTYSSRRVFVMVEVYYLLFGISCCSVLDWINFSKKYKVHLNFFVTIFTQKSMNKIYSLFSFLLFSLQINAQSINPNNLSSSKDSLIFYQNQIAKTRQNFTKDYNRKYSSIVHSQDSIVNLIKSWDELFNSTKGSLDSIIIEKEKFLKGNKKLSNILLCIDLPRIVTKGNRTAELKKFFVVDEKSVKKINEITNYNAPMAYVAMGVIEVDGRPYHKYCYIISFDLNNPDIFAVNTYVVDYKKSPDSEITLYLKDGNVSEFDKIERIEKKGAIDSLTINNVVYHANEEKKREYHYKENQQVFKKFNCYFREYGKEGKVPVNYNDLGLKVMSTTSPFFEVYCGGDVLFEQLMFETYKSLLTEAKIFHDNRVADLQGLLRSLNIVDFKKNRNSDSLSVEATFKYYFDEFPKSIASFQIEYDKALVEDKLNEEKHKKDLNQWNIEAQTRFDASSELAFEYLKTKLLDPFSVRDATVRAKDKSYLKCSCMQVLLFELYEKNIYGAYEGKSTYLVFMSNDSPIDYDKVVDDINADIRLNMKIVSYEMLCDKLCSGSSSKPTEYVSKAKSMKKPRLEDINSHLSLKYSKIMGSGKVASSPFRTIGVNDFHRNYLMRSFLLWYKTVSGNVNLFTRKEQSLDIKNIDSWVFDEFTDEGGNIYNAWEDKYLNQLGNKIVDETISKSDVGKTYFELWKMLPNVSSKFIKSPNSARDKVVYFEQKNFTPNPESLRLFSTSLSIKDCYTSVFWSPCFTEVSYYFSVFCNCHTLPRDKFGLFSEIRLSEN